MFKKSKIKKRACTLTLEAMTWSLELSNLSMTYDLSIINGSLSYMHAASSHMN